MTARDEIAKWIDAVRPDGSKLTHAEIAQLVGVSRERVRQIMLAEFGETGRTRQAEIAQVRHTARRKAIVARIPARLQELVSKLRKMSHIVTRNSAWTSYSSHLMVNGVLCTTSIWDAPPASTCPKDGKGVARYPARYRRFRSSLLGQVLIGYSSGRIWVIPTTELVKYGGQAIYVREGGIDNYNGITPQVDFRQYENRFDLLPIRTVSETDTRIDEAVTGGTPAAKE